MGSVLSDLSGLLREMLRRQQRDAAAELPRETQWSKNALSNGWSQEVVDYADMLPNLSPYLLLSELAAMRDATPRQCQTVDLLEGMLRAVDAKDWVSARSLIATGLVQVKAEVSGDDLDGILAEICSRARMIVGMQYPCRTVTLQDLARFPPAYKVVTAMRLAPDARRSERGPRPKVAKKAPSSTSHNDFGRDEWKQFLAGLSHDLSGDVVRQRLADWGPDERQVGAVVRGLHGQKRLVLGRLEKSVRQNRSLTILSDEDGECAHPSHLRLPDAPVLALFEVGQRGDPRVSPLSSARSHVSSASSRSATSVASSVEEPDLPEVARSESGCCAICGIHEDDHPGSAWLECGKCRRWNAQTCTRFSKAVFARMSKRCRDGGDWTCDACMALSHDDADRPSAQIGARRPLEQVPSAFRCGQSQPPDLAALKGEALKGLRVFDKPTHPRLTEDGLSAAVRARHRSILRDCQRELRAEELSLPLGEALVRLMDRRRLERKWSWATTHREMANLTGALSHLPVYTDSPVPIRLVLSPAWRDALRNTEMRAKESEGQSPPASTLHQVQAAVSKCLNPETRVAMMLAWLTAARCGCILQLKRQDVALAPDRSLTVTFRRGKGVKFRGPYTVPTLAPVEWMPALRRWLDSCSPLHFLFPADSVAHRCAKGRLIMLALRSVDPSLNQRAIRRGALQHMARAGVPIEDLMVFSGHKSRDTLNRYLRWGLDAEVTAQHTRVAARLLGGESSA